MTEADIPAFSALVSKVHAYYRQPTSEFVIGVFWEACKGFEFEAVRDAFNRHAVNPDEGRFCPKAADIVRAINGGTQDRALVAWTKVDKAVRRVGGWSDVAFDDALIHVAIDEMGGWIDLCSKSEKDWDFVRNQFVTRYRGQLSRGTPTAYPRQLTGRANHENAQRGMPLEPFAMVGETTKVLAVVAGGSDSGALPITFANPAQAAAVKRLTASSA